VPIPQIALSHAKEIAFRAFITGGDEAHLHGDCEEPVTIGLRGVAEPLFNQLKTISDDPFVDWYKENGKTVFLPHRAPDEARPPATQTVWLKVRCRKCIRCLWAKRRLWTAKAIAEVRSANRTWLVTLTCDGHRRTWARFAAEKWCNTARSETFNAMSEADRTKALAKFISPEVTRWLKRVRKSSGVPLRYLLVVEPHKDGFPHYHLLVHEPSAPVTKRELQGAWKWGFSNARLLEQGDVKGTQYACKYLTKAVQTRVRASRQYGSFRPKTENGEVDLDARNEEPSAAVQPIRTVKDYKRSRF